MTEKMLIVNSASAKKAEQLTAELRKALGTLKIKLPDLLPISTLLTKWIKDNHYPNDLVLQSTKFLEVVQDQVNDTLVETPAQRFDVDFVIMTSVLKDLLGYLSLIFFKNKEDENENLRSSSENEEHLSISVQ